MNHELISIIVPVYKVEKYLERCARSLTAQSYANLEILLIDDGSPDNCPALCDELALADNRIRVIHKQNEGLAAAWNTGVSQATGRYVTFVDSDDYVSVNYVSDLYGLITANKADMSITSFCRVYENTGKIKNAADSDYTLVMSREEALGALLYQKHFITTAWGKLYKKELFDGVLFPVGKFGEDLGTIYRLIAKSNLVAYRSVINYYYLQRGSSIVFAHKKELGRHALELSEELHAFITDNYPGLKGAAISRRFSVGIYILERTPFSQIYNKDCSEVIALIKRYRRSVLKDPQTRLISKGCAFLSYFGIWALKVALTLLVGVKKR